jgi:phage terminase small subunit
MSTGLSGAKPKPLTVKAKRFVEEYCIDWNGAQAAERSGYSPKSAKQTAYDLLRDERVQAAIEKHMSLYSMSAVEAIAKLAEWGRGSIKRFLRVGQDGQLEINLDSAEAKAHLHLIREMTQTRSTIIMGDVERTEVRTVVKLHDAKDAVDKILKIHGRYAPQKVDHTTDGQPLPGTNIYVPDNGR